jgi:hypothetical protein
MATTTIEKEEEKRENGLDPEALRRIQNEIQEIKEKEAKRQNKSPFGHKNFIKFPNDGDSKRLLFTGRWVKDDKVPMKDFKTGQVKEGKFVTEYYFECHDITNPDKPSEASTWQRGLRDAGEVFYWLSKNQNVLDVTREGAAGSNQTKYRIHPPMK